MRAVLLEVPAELLAERARRGIDVFDEMWEGVLHMVPPASEEHQRIGTELLIALHGAVAQAGLLLRYETGLFDPEAPETSNYRVPDLMAFASDRKSDRGVEGRAALVVEIRSPGDECLEKMGFYEQVGVREVIVIDRDTKQVRHWQRGGDGLVEAEHDDDAVIALTELAVTLQVVDGGLAVETATGRTLI